PHLLAVDDPFVAVETGLGLDIGQIGSGAGLGVALTPEFGDVANAGQEPPLLLLGAERDQGGSEQFLAQMVDLVRGVGVGVLLVEDDLLVDRQAAAAVLDGPAEAGPAALGEVPVPGETLLEGLVLTAGTARAAQRGVRAGVGDSAELAIEPSADLGAHVGRGHLVRPPSPVAGMRLRYRTKQLFGWVSRSRRRPGGVR